MIAITPNLRFVKPLTKYMEKRIRMFGRQRFANTFEKTGSNQKTVELPWLPDSAPLLEIYHDSVRVVEGYTVSGQTVIFDTALNGRLEFISDTVFPDMNEKWLTLSINNLLHSDDLANTAYGTDRREGPQVATHCMPVCITQGAIGFTRPGIDTDTLIYCSYYGLYGRDSVTYAIKSDLGQYSDYRCIDIRVRDPNYIPEIRLCAVSLDSSPLMIDGEVVDIVPNGNWQVYAEIKTGQQIKLPNKMSADEVKEYHFIIQGKDENGDWFELTEYFDEDEYELKVPNSDDYGVSYVGTSELFGFENAVRISIGAHKNTTAPLTISLSANKRQLFTGRIISSGMKDVSTISRSAVEGATLDLERNVDGIVFPPDEMNDPEIDDDPSVWALEGSWFNGNGITLTTNYTSPLFEKRNVRATINAAVSIPIALYDPVTLQFLETEFDVSRVINGSFTTNVDPLLNAVVVDKDASIKLTGPGFFWESQDQFSPMYNGDGLSFFFNNVWSIK